MFHVKLTVILIFAVFGLVSCLDQRPKQYVIAESKSYEASMFRQHCAICHGSEGKGKTLNDGTIVPNMREGALKFKTAPEIYNQIANGGNGMLPFRNQLTERELKLMADFVHNDLRKTN